MTPSVRERRGAAATACTTPAVELDAMAQDQKPRGRGQRSHAPSWKVEHAPACHAGEVVVGSEIAIEAQAARLHVHLLLEQALRGQAPEVGNHSQKLSGCYAPAARPVKATPALTTGGGTGAAVAMARSLRYDETFGG